MANPALIFGSGGHARVIASVVAARARGVTFVSREAATGALSEEDFWRDPSAHRGADVYIGIGDNAVRARIFARLRQAGLTVATCVSPGAFVDATAQLGPGVFVSAGAVVHCHAQVGEGAIVNTLSSVDHDGELGDFAQLTAGVILGGGVKIRPHCFLGIRSAVIPGLTVGEGCIVMAGSLVTKSLPPRVMVGGSPAQVMQTLG